MRSHRYEFANGNEYVTHANPYSMGRALLAEGNLPEAIKALEAEVQRNGDNSDAWLALGLVSAAPLRCHVPSCLPHSAWSQPDLCDATAQRSVFEQRCCTARRRRACTVPQ